MARIIAIAALLCLLVGEAPPQPEEARVAFEKEATQLIADHTAAIARLETEHAAVLSTQESIRLVTLRALYEGMLDRPQQGLAGRLIQMPVDLRRWITSYGRRRPGALPYWRTDTEHSGARVTAQGVVLTNDQDSYMEWCHEALLSDLTPFVAKLRLLAPGGAKVGIQNRGTSAMFLDIPPRVWCDVIINREGPLDEVAFYFNGAQAEVKQATSITDRLTIHVGRDHSVYIAQLEFWIWQDARGR